MDCKIYRRMIKISKGRIAVRVPQPWLDRLNDYVKRIGVSKTDVVIGAISNYLGFKII